MGKGMGSVGNTRENEEGREARTLVQKEREPVQKERESVQKEREPVQKERESVQKERESVQKEFVLAQRELLLELLSVQKEPAQEQPSHSGPAQSESSHR